MADEPGGWELRRAVEQQRADMREGFAQLNSRLDKLVSQDAFQAEQRRVEDRLKAIERDQAAEKVDRLAAIAAEEQDRKDGDATQQGQLDSFKKFLWAFGVALVLPVALFLANIYLAGRGK